jgi:hypothetical protein
MSNYVKLANEASDSYLAALNANQENFLKSVTAFAAWLPASPTPTTLVSADLPTMQEITEANFGFAQRFLRQQQEFVEKFIAVSTPRPSSSDAARSVPLRSKGAPAS